MVVVQELPRKKPQTVVTATLARGYGTPGTCVPALQARSGCTQVYEMLLYDRHAGAAAEKATHDRQLPRLLGVA